MDSNLVLGYGLIVLGIVLLGAELLFFSGMLFVLALAALAIGVTLTFSYDTTTGIVTLLTLVVSLPVLGAVLIHFWSRTRVGQKFFLQSPEDETMRTEHQELERLIGRYGKTISALRPAGVADFDGRRIDTITEGMPVEPDQWVRCIDVRAGKVIVRPAERPGLGDLETAIFR
jgi:membrane-bound serine protease (ClpP class)